MPSKRKPGVRDSESSSADEGGSFDVYHTAAVTFQNCGQYAKAIANYTKVSNFIVASKQLNIDELYFCSHLPLAQ